MYPIYLQASPDYQDKLDQLAQTWQLVHCEQSRFVLHLTAERLQLSDTAQPKMAPIFVDFVAGAVAHRRKFGGGKNQAIAKAVGLNKGVLPTVVDGTAGMGKDAFVLASLGCRVYMIERHPVIAALLDDGLMRARQDSEIGEWMQRQMSLIHAVSSKHLNPQSMQGISVDVVYLDPMYPHNKQKNTALVKKEMQIFQQLVGADEDADLLLQPALNLAQKRVVVKRPQHAGWLAGIKPTLSIESKKTRFDIYVNASIVG